jgi:hypothetical protein
MKPAVIFSLLVGISISGPVSLAAEPKNPGDRESSVSATGASQPSLSIITRDEWGAKPALPGMKEQKVTGIIIHHTGVRMNPAISIETKMRGLQNFSQHPGKVSPKKDKPAWPDVPYHFYIDNRGTMAEGRDVHFAGDTNTGYDTDGYIQVVVEGDFEKENPDPAQLNAVRDLLVWLLTTWNLPPERISVHMDHAPTDCPGRNFMSVLPGVLAEVRDRLHLPKDNSQPKASSGKTQLQHPDTPVMPLEKTKPVKPHPKPSKKPSTPQ